MYYVTYAWESSITNPYINMSDEEFMVSIKHTNYSAEMSLWREMSLGEMIVKIVVMALVFLTAVTGNFLVPIVLLRERRLRTVTHIFLVNLTVADMLVALSTTWVHLIDDFTSRWILGAFVCKFSTLTQSKCDSSLCDSFLCDSSLCDSSLCAPEEGPFYFMFLSIIASK